MDNTIETALKIISKLPDGWRKRYWVKRVNEEISGWRLTALENPRTEMARLLTHKANTLEKRLGEIITPRKV